MPKLPIISAKDFLRCVLRYGCILINIEGSHFKVENPKTGARATIPVHAGRDMDRGFMKKILTQLGIDEDDFIASL
jgi:predicted RNA binding protein YcfA (HicA-like mRNA interferase family)